MVSVVKNAKYCKITSISGLLSELQSIPISHVLLAPLTFEIFRCKSWCLESWDVLFYPIHGMSQEEGLHLKNASTWIKVMMLETVLVYFRCFQLGSVILPGFDRHSFPLILEIFCRKLFSKSTKNQGKQGATFPFVSLPNDDETCMCSFLCSSWENRIPLSRLFILWEGLCHPPKRIARAKACSKSLLWSTNLRETCSWF